MTTGSFNVYLDSYNGSSKSWSGSDSPKGSRRENPYSCTITRSVTRPGEVWQDYTGSGQLPSGVFSHDGFYVGNGPWPTLPDWSWNKNLELECLSRLASQIRGHDFNAAVTAAELPQSIETVVRSAKAFVDALARLRRKDFGGAVRSFSRIAHGLNDPVALALRRKRVTRGALTPLQRAKFELSGDSAGQAQRMLHSGDISGALLAMQYGWKPLLSDIYELSKALSATVDSTQQQGIVYRAQRANGWNTVRVYTDGSGGWVYSPNAINRYFPSAKWQLRVAYRVRIASQLRVADALGLTDPATVIWEKIPFSFVADWFVPLGDYLQTRSTLSSLAVTEVTKTTFRSRRIESEGASTGSFAPGFGNSSIRGQSRHALNMELNRSLISPVALSVPRPHLPSFEKAFSTTHLANGAALIHQAIRQFRRA